MQDISLFKDSHEGQGLLNLLQIFFLGDKNLIYSYLTLAVQSHSLSAEWSPKVAIVMITCNLVAIVIGYYGISKQNRGQGPDLPVSLPAIFTGFGIPELLATTSFGHILGAGMILGLGSAGML